MIIILILWCKIYKKLRVFYIYMSQDSKNSIEVHVQFKFVLSKDLVFIKHVKWVSWIRFHPVMLINILLMWNKSCGRLKLSNTEIKKAIMTMDEQEDLPKDMLEQVSHMTAGSGLLWRATRGKACSITRSAQTGRIHHIYVYVIWRFIQGNLHAPHFTRLSS